MTAVAAQPFSNGNRKRASDIFGILNCMHDTTPSPHDLHFLRRAIEVARCSRANGNHPFGAVLVDAHNTVLLEAENSVGITGDVTGHAEINLVRRACTHISREILATCTLYSSTEPCAMCSGAIHWGGIGRVVYALSETGLYAITGHHIHNDTMALPCRDIFAACHPAIEVVGPAIEDEARIVHEGFWL